MKFFNFQVADCTDSKENHTHGDNVCSCRDSGADFELLIL